ncbi:DUF6221 family protein [Oerskovia paurometabola]|uniref:DUF6221 family protein n=1 Tax=Oerskovia paurometabola TaxID=162170 RepID=UPI0038061C2B
MTLTEFLEARIAELEAVARDALAPLGDGPRRDFYSTIGPHGDDWGLYTFHVPPARVLAECEAKRRIVERCRPLVAVVWRESDRLLASAFDETHMPTLAHSAPVWPNEHAEATLRDLALPYNDHPDYDEAWRP